MGFVLGTKPEHETLWFFCVKWLQAAMKGTSSVRRVRLRSVFLWPHCNGGFKLLWVCLCVCVRSCRVFWNLWLQIALEWLHDCCHLVLPCAYIRAGLRRDAAKRIVMAASPRLHA